MSSFETNKNGFLYSSSILKSLAKAIIDSKDIKVNPSIPKSTLHLKTKVTLENGKIMEEITDEQKYD